METDKPKCPGLLLLVQQKAVFKETKSFLCNIFKVNATNTSGCK